MKTTTAGSTKRRTLIWSKEVERRTRDEYRRIWPEAHRAKFIANREAKGASDIVGVPHHVQVKARAVTWIGTTFREAVRHAGGRVTHLVTQDRQGEPLVTMRLKDYINDRRDALDSCPAAGDVCDRHPDRLH